MNMIIENFLAKKTCEEITSSMRINEDIIDAAIKKQDEIKFDENKHISIRETNIYELSSAHEELYNESFVKHQKDIEKFFNLEITNSSEIQVLENTNENKGIGFLPIALEKKVTMILFTTNHSDIISKNNSNEKEVNDLQIKPKIGDMIIFLSNPSFTDEVLEVKKAYRASLVQGHDAIIH